METPTPENQPAATTENSSGGATRRDLFRIGNMLALPALMSAFESETAAAPASVSGPLKAGPDIYQSIGVEPVINCRGTFTIIGADVELPQVRAAMEAACQKNVQLDELAEGVGKRLAELTGAEWGMVSSGCAAGLKLVAAGCVAGGNPEKLIRIPDLTGLEKTEVVIPRSSRSVYDHAIRNVGLKVIMVDTAEELASALSSRTALIYMEAGGATQQGPLALENVAKIAKPKGIPILVDAAAEILTIPNVHLQKGADVVAYSGGKAMRGPQCAGLLLGRKDILMAAWQAGSPHHGPGRDNKVGREEHIGMLAAVEAWVATDHDAVWKQWLSWLNAIADKMKTIDGVTTAIREPNGLSNRSPGLTISWDPDRLHVTGEEVAEELATTKPRIALGGGGGGGRGGRGGRGGGGNAGGAPTTSVSITAWMMQPENVPVVAERLHAALTQRRAPKTATPPAAPAANLSGRWDVTMEYFYSKSQHTMFLTQDGNHISGSHKSDFAIRDINGSIEGTEIKMRSQWSQPGDSVGYIFDGKLNGDTFSGKVHMGEYMTAMFSAKRMPYPAGPGAPIRIPTGPPLAN
jgi:D-glucosaminate-6-phosphate ammonia-lyase